MTTAPMESRPGSNDDAEGLPAGDPGDGGPGVGDPSEDTGEDSGESTTPPGYPDEVDPAQGPAADRDAGLLRPVSPDRD